ncbi:MAG: glycosyltransferase family 1 protein [Eubacterium sp.]|nr:glycosyltransferase family 1 protein [Eubacterium sp.]
MTILYFAPIYYNDMKQRPQQIAECLAKKHKVYYVEPTVSLVRWLLKGGRTFAGMRQRVSDNLTVLRLNGCLTVHKSIEILDLCGVNSLSELWQLRRLIRECDLVWTGYSGWYPLIRHWKHVPVLFDKMDEEAMLVSSRLWRMTLQRNQRKILHMADIVTVTAVQFYEERKAKKKKAYLIPNAVSDSFASGIGAHGVSFGRLGKAKAFGYIGTIGEWFDEAVIEKLLELDSEYEIYLAGRNYRHPILHPRVHYLGILENEKLPALLETFDVCLYNFKKSPLLSTINPVKIYEYLALNKPVLAVTSKETLRFQDYLALYEDVEEIADIIRHGFCRPFKDAQSHRQFLLQNSWAARTEQIEQILREEVFGR